MAIQRKRTLARGGESTWGSHKVGTVLRCLRAYAWDRWLESQGLEATSPAVSFGTDMHELLAWWYAGGEGSPPEVRDEHAWETFEAYQARWKRDPWLRARRRVEHEMRVEIEVPERLRRLLGTTTLYTQRADLIVQERDRVWIVDHKTTATSTASVVDRAPTSPQVIGYHWLGQRLWGPRYAGVVFNVIERGRWRRNGARTRAPLFSRHTLLPTPAVRTYEDVVLRAKAQVAWWERKGVPWHEWPPSWGEQCWGRGAPCPARLHCLGMLPPDQVMVLEDG